MEQRPLEITILSANGLKDVGAFSKMDVYVAVSISGDPRSEQKTPVDTDGGSSPRWNHGPMTFTLAESAVQMNQLNLVFRLRHERKLMGDKDVGEVHVAVKELLDKGGDGKSAETVEFPVRKPSGKVKGSIKFSYKFGEVHKIEPYPQPTGQFAPPPVTPKDGYGAPATAYPGPPSGYYAPPPQPAGYPPYAPPSGYPPAPGYGYSGYQQPAPGGYTPMGYGGYQQPIQAQKPQKSSGMGMGAGLGLGLAGGLIGGMVIGDMVSDANEDAYEAGYEAGLDDAGF